MNTYCKNDFYLKIWSSKNVVKTILHNKKEEVTNHSTSNTKTSGFLLEKRVRISKIKTESQNCHNDVTRNSNQNRHK